MRDLVVGVEVAGLNSIVDRRPVNFAYQSYFFVDSTVLLRLNNGKMKAVSDAWPALK